MCENKGIVDRMTNNDISNKQTCEILSNEDLKQKINETCSLIKTFVTCNINQSNTCTQNRKTNSEKVIDKTEKERITKEMSTQYENQYEQNDLTKCQNKHVMNKVSMKVELLSDKT